VKVHLQVGGFDSVDPLLDEAWQRLAEAGTPIVLQAGAVADGSGNEQWCGPEPVRRPLHRFPRLRLVITHMGTPDEDAFVGLAEVHDRLWLDMAMVFTDPPYLGPPSVHLADRIGALGDRVVFGSDLPTIPHQFAAQVSGLASPGLGDDWLRGVLWHNGPATPGQSGQNDGRRPSVRPRED
jgi:uncharacterized protein